MLQANFTVSPLTGSVLATEFTVVNLTSGGSVQQYTWDFGTGELVYHTVNPTKIYNYPGNYTITLTAVNFDGQTSTYTQQVSVELEYRDYIKFSQIPERFADPGKLTPTAFKIDVVSSNPDKPLIVDLFASNSKSIPYQFASDRWTFLTPTWKFLDKDQNFITTLSVESTPLYKNNIVVAVSGTAEFYYIDSQSNGDPTQSCPILITATLQTSGFSNPLDSNIYPYESHSNNKTVRAGVIWQVNDLTPTLLKVTGNYIDDIYPTQWTDIKIPILITAHSNRAQILSGSEDSISEIIFSYPSTNATGRQAPVLLSFSNLTSSDYTIDEAPLYFQATDKNGFTAGGYIFTTATGLTSITATSITAQTTAITNLTYNANEFPYPYGYAPNTPVWVSNPSKNTLNKITLVPDPGNCNTINYFKDNNILTDGIIKEVQVPALSTSNTFNYTLSGFSGIYSVAIDPRNYDIVAADAELDRLYRFSNTGEILKSFELSSIGDFDPRKKMYEFWTWRTPAQETSATRFAFYKPVPHTSNIANYIVTLGGVIQPTNVTEVYPYEGGIRLLVDPGLGVPFNQDTYPPEDLEFNVIQLFNPTLPSKYATSLTYWTTSSPIDQSVFLFTNNPSLSSNPGYYMVSVDGILQRPNSYTIDDTAKTITLDTPAPADTTVHILYMPEILPPAIWTNTFTSITTSISLTGDTNYRLDDQSSFIVNIGGVLQNPENYKHNLTTQSLDFNTALPINTPISVVQLSIPDTIENTAAYTPAYVSLDKNYNIWVSLFNTVSVLKFDPNFNLLFSVAPSNIKWPTRAWTNNPAGIDYQASRFEEISRMSSLSTNDSIDRYTDEFFLKPPVVETDKNNNCWVTYANPLCSMLVKYSETGDILSQIELGQYSTPINLTINSQNNVWVANYHGSSYTYTSLSGNIQLYDTNTSQLLKTVTNISRPGYIALDRSNNLWFTHSLRRIGYFNTTTNTLCAWTLELSGGFSVYVTPSSLEANLESFDELENEQDEELGGLAVDVYNRVWVLDSVQNFAWVISATPNFNQAPIRYFKIIPDATIGYYLDIPTGSTYTESDDFYYYRSAQATGDWTGNRWYQKYAYPSAISAIPVSGISTPFSVSEFINEHQIKRVNESFNTAEYYKSLALPEILNLNPVLFDKFFPAAVGTGYLSANEDPGQVVYERTANFVQNHSDVDTCNIDQLLSLAEEVAVSASDYAAIYPTDIRNMLDIGSVTRARLWGIKDEVPILTQSIGTEYNTQTDSLTAGTKIILKSRFDSSLSLLAVPPLTSGELIYPVQQFGGYGLVEPITVNYIFYRFEPSYTGNYIENVIDWKSPYTTQSITASTLEEWYGDGGSLETAFRYLLTKNLFLK
jgi:PKD repeat protein